MVADFEKKKIIVRIDAGLTPLIPGFLENRMTDIGKLYQALEQGDFKMLGAIGHDLKGLGGGYGFGFISESGAAIESLAKSANAEAIGEKINRLDDYLKRIEIEYI